MSPQIIRGRITSPGVGVSPISLNAASESFDTRSSSESAICDTGGYRPVRWRNRPATRSSSASHSFIQPSEIS